MFKKTLIFILLCFTVVRAQNYTRVDTLVYELEQLPMDTSRVDILTQLLDEISWINPKGALAYSSQITDLSIASGYKFGIAFGYFHQGAANVSLGNIDVGINNYRTAIPFFIDIDSLSYLADVYNNMAYTYMVNGQPDSALKYDFKCLTIDIQLKDTSGIISSLINTGGVYLRQDKLKEALNCDITALGLSIEIGDEILVSAALRNIARILMSQQDYDEAFYCFLNSYNISKRFDDREQMAKVLNNMGNLVEMKGNYKLAMSYYHQAIAAIDGLGYRREMGNIQTSIGRLYFKHDSMGLALKYYTDALQNYRESNVREGICDVTYLLGELYFSKKDYQVAKVHLEESYKLSEQLGYPQKIMNSSGLLSKVYKNEGSFEKFSIVLERYVEMKDSISNNDYRKQMSYQKEQFDEYKAQLIIEIEEKKREEKLNSEIARRNVLQYSIMLLSILLSFGLILSLGYIKLPYRVAQAFIFVTLLTLFEIILVLTDPLLDSITHNVPLYKVMANLFVALSIFPIQTFMEKRLKKRLDKLKK